MTSRVPSSRPCTASFAAPQFPARHGAKTHLAPCSPVPPALVPLAEYARARAVGVRTLRRYLAIGVIAWHGAARPGRPALLDARACDAAIARYRVARPGPMVATSAAGVEVRDLYRAERSRLARARRELAELALARVRARLLPRATVEAGITAAMAVIAARLAAIPENAATSGLLSASALEWLRAEVVAAVAVVAEVRPLGA